MITTDSRLWTSTLRDILLMVLLGGTWFLGGVRDPLLFALPLLWSAMSALRDFLRLRQAQTRHHAALALAPRLLPRAAHQPISNAGALPLPYTVSHRLSWLAYALLTLLLWGMLVLGPLVGSPHRLDSSFLVISLLLASALTPLGLRADSQQLTLTEEGLTMRSPYRRQTIRWSEARLFAIEAAAARTELPNSYELSTATTSVQWRRATRPAPFLHLDRPFQEYAWQMERLLELIAGRTGLPLIDLRQPQVQAGSQSTD